MCDEFRKISTSDFDFSDEILEKIQQNIEEIIMNFPVAQDDKLDVISKLNFMYSRTRHLVETDELTGLKNRRMFDYCFDMEFERMQRYGRNLCLAIIDIDFFKKVNDTYGHLCGDFILKEIAYLFHINFRKTDMIFRYGGEEFAVILPETDDKSAKIPLERLRKTVENYDFVYNGTHLKITISIGASSKKYANTEEFFKQTDNALYTSKSSGRNTLTFT